MNDELIKGNQQHNPDNAANAANNAGGQSQQERIVNSVIAAPTQNNPTRQTNPAEQKPHKPVGIRIWRSLWRRRKWRNIRKSDRPPINWVEKSTLAVAFLVFVITSIQAMIYYWQADLMQKQIVQAQSANRRQLVIAAESNQITREALESVQRAFITFKGVDTNGRNLNPPNGSHAWIFYPGVENSGTTPAVAAISYVTAKTLPSGPTEQQFIGPKTDHHVTVQYTVGPKALQRLGPLYPKDIEMFGTDLGDDFSGYNSHTAVINRKFFVWGWVAYGDVLPNTQPHITEFCFHLAGVTSTVPRPSRADQIGFMTLSCEHHNCTDQYCDDYKEIMQQLQSEGYRVKTNSQ